MLQAVPPLTEVGRIAALRSYDVLDTACERSFNDLLGLAASIAGTPTALISFVDTDRQWFKSRIGLDVRETPRDLAFCAHAILTPMHPLIVPDATQDPRFAANPLVTGPRALRFYAGFPLVNPEGFALGTLCLLDYVPRSLPPATVAALAVLAQAVMTTLELRRAMFRMRDLALSDALTGLPNRPALLDALGQAIARQRRDQRPFTVLYIDLDGFKRINDLFGHTVGDAVLRAAAAIIRDNIRQEDCAARLGGDEFGVVLVGGADDIADPVAERIRTALEEGLAARGWPVTASIGSVTFVEPPADESVALAAADMQMYAAKHAGCNRVVQHAYADHRQAAVVH